MVDSSLDNVARIKRRRTYDDALLDQQKRLEDEEQAKGRKNRSKT